VDELKGSLLRYSQLHASPQLASINANTNKSFFIF